MKKRNILLILTDQQRFDTIEALGNRIIKTPTLNKLVERGISFTRAYTPSPVCVPARYSIHTGQMPHRTNCTINETMPDGRVSFMEILSQNGYQTHGVGKMHFTFKSQGMWTMWGFDSRDVSEECTNEGHYRKYLNDNGFSHVYDTGGVRSEMYYIPQPSQLPAKLHNSTWVVDRSVEFLKRRDTDKPFFLMTSFIKPHPPFESPTPWNKLYRGPEMPLPKRPKDHEKLMTFWNKYQNRYKGRDQGTDDNLIRNIKASYYSSISFVDFNLNRLFEYLESENILDDTLIIFTSDHGEMLGDYNCFGKRCFLDSAARIPLILSGPDIEKDTTCDRPVSLIDILPTLLQYANIDEKEDYSGKSLADVAHGNIGRDTIFGQYNRAEYATYMAVSEKFKYIYSAADDKEWLFDLLIDPEETVNKANNLMYVQESRNMRNKIIKYFKDDGYTDPLDGDNWKRYEPKAFSDDPEEFLLFQDTQESIPNIPGYQRESGRRVHTFKVGF